MAVDGKKLSFFPRFKQKLVGTSRKFTIWRLALDVRAIGAFINIGRASPASLGLFGRSFPSSCDKARDCCKDQNEKRGCNDELSLVFRHLGLWLENVFWSKAYRIYTSKLLGSCFYLSTQHGNAAGATRCFILRIVESEREYAI